MMNTIIVPLIIFAMFLGVQIEADADANENVNGKIITAYSHIQPCDDCEEWQKQ